MPSTLTNRCMTIKVTSRRVKAYFRRLRNNNTNGTHSRILWGPVEGRGACCNTHTRMHANTAYPRHPAPAQFVRPPQNIQRTQSKAIHVNNPTARGKGHRDYQKAQNTREENNKRAHRGTTGTDNNVATCGPPSQPTQSKMPTPDKCAYVDATQLGQHPVVGCG